jgi:hypothetical protein
VNTYSWEIQRKHFAGLWSYQVIAGQPEDPRGYDRSELDADAFARHIAHTHPVDGPHRIAVWDTPGVGRHPVAILTNA